MSLPHKIPGIVQHRIVHALQNLKNDILKLNRGFRLKYNFARLFTFGKSEHGSQCGCSLCSIRIDHKSRYDLWIDWASVSSTTTKTTTVIKITFILEQKLMEVTLPSSIDQRNTDVRFTKCKAIFHFNAMRSIWLI